MFKTIGDLASHLEKKNGARTTTPPSVVRPASAVDNGPSMRPLPRSVVHGFAHPHLQQQPPQGHLSTSPSVVSPASTTPISNHGHHHHSSTNGHGGHNNHNNGHSSIDSIHNLRVVTHGKKIMGRLIIVGDVHGCPDQLRELVQKVQYNRNMDVLVIAGDLVNKGPDSLNAVRVAMDLGAYAVLGNHDITVLNFVDKIESGEVRPSNKKHAKDPAVGVAMSLTEDVLPYLRRLPHVIKFPQFNVVVVHAGFNTSFRLEEQTVRDVTNIRRLLWNGQEGVYESITSGSEGTLWAQLWHGPETVVFGHDARTGLQQEPYAIGLDTGCCYGGALSAVVFPGGEIVQVQGLPPAVRSAEVTPAAPTPSMVSQIEASFPHHPSSASNDDDTTMAPAVMQLFEASRRLQQQQQQQRATPSSVVVAAPSSGGSSPTPPTATADPSSSSLSYPQQQLRLQTLQLLLQGNHVLAVLTLLRDDGYQSAWSSALDGSLDAPPQSWAAATCSCASYLLSSRAMSDEVSSVLDLLVEVLNEKKSAVPSSAIFEVQKLISHLESGQIAGVGKSAIKALKLSLK